MHTASITRTYKRTVHQYAGIICYVLLFDVHTVQKENSLFHPFFFLDDLMHGDLHEFQTKKLKKKSVT